MQKAFAGIHSDPREAATAARPRQYPSASGPGLDLLIDSSSDTRLEEWQIFVHSIVITRGDVRGDREAAKPSLSRDCPAERLHSKSLVGVGVGPPLADHLHHGTNTVESQTQDDGRPTRSNVTRASSGPTCSHLTPCSGNKLAGTQSALSTVARN